MSYIGNTPGVSSQRVVLEEVVSGSPKSAFVPLSGYIKGYLDVLVNGIELDNTDFTATDGVTVNLVTAAAVGDTVKIKAWIPRGLSDGYRKDEVDAFLATLYTKTEADARYLRLIGGSLTGGLTAAGNLLMTANDGNARVVGVSNGTNTTLVLQGGGNGAGALGGNIELGRDGNNMIDGNLTRIRSLDGSTPYGQFDATGFSFANYLTGGSVPLARLSASGTTALSGIADATTYLRGDGAWTTLPPSNDASALTTGTLAIARLADSSITAAKLASGAAASNLGSFVSALEGSTGSIALANLGVFGRSISSSGYQKLPGGLIIQWGWRGNGGVGFYWQTFPMTFPNACFGLVVSIVRSSAMGDYRAWYGQNTTGAYIATDQGDTFYIAMGY